RTDDRAPDVDLLRARLSVLAVASAGGDESGVGGAAVSPFATKKALTHSPAMTGGTIPKPDYEAALRQAGVRVTRPRRVILDILSDAGDHPDAMEIFKRAVAVDPSVSLSTVYRTM